MNGTELGQEMSDSVNSGINSEDLTSTISREHRHLQGEVFNQIIRPLIVEFARKADEGEFDARNKRECEKCKEIADAMNWSY
jgi:hypothetical protein